MKLGSILVLLLCVALGACAQQRHVTDDQPVTLSLSNTGTRSLSCRLMFGHWVDRDLGDLGPGTATKVDMTQSAEDGALYVMRSDGQRRMMIETIQCARDGHWMETFGQVDFAPIRSRRARAIEASCAAPVGEGRVACRLDRFE
ncbi:MAG TPA: hypothetical protein VGJ75_15895 [Dongiaceae bacterium]|jgi:hypothetical protein